VVRALIVALLFTAGCGPIVLEPDPRIEELDEARDAGNEVDAGFLDAGTRDGGFARRDGGPSHAADINSDGCVDSVDLDLVQELWGEPGPEGDANEDGVVDVRDLNMVLAAWGTGCPDAGVRDSGNDTGNGR
jgi:hypothetical protein